MTCRNDRRGGGGRTKSYRLKTYRLKTYRLKAYRLMLCTRAVVLSTQGQRHGGQRSWNSGLRYKEHSLCMVVFLHKG